MRASSVVLLPHARASVSVARQRLCAELVAVGVTKPAVDDAAIVISELLSNALRHARPLPSGLIQVAWNRRGEMVELAVSDGGATTEPVPARPALSSLGGRGLRIVEALAFRWGVHRVDGTTTVWAALPAPAAIVGNGRLGAPQPAPGWRETPGLLGPVATPLVPDPAKIHDDGAYAMVRGGHRVPGQCLAGGGNPLISDPQGGFRHRQPR